MKKPYRLLRVVSGLLLVAVVAYWAAAGAHRGWSMNRVPIKKTDDLTGIEYVEYEDRFVPGVEVLAGGVGASVLLFGLSFLFRKRSSQP